MRRSFFAASLILMLGLTVPANGQSRTQAAAEVETVRLYDYGQTGFTLNRYFSPEHFRMSHSVEFSTGSFGGSGSSLAMYTNSMMWQFSRKLAARLDVAFAYSPFQDDRLRGVTGSNSGQVFIKNAELAYRPGENTLIQLSFRQSPYGTYASPYGYRGYGLRQYRGNSFRASFGSDYRDLFWNERLK